VQEAEIARAAKALGQHALEKQPEELGAAEQALFGLAGFAFAIADWQFSPARTPCSRMTPR